MPSLGDVVAPRRLGIDFRWLLASSWTSNLGDGIALSAAPLLIASLTSSPLLVAAGAMMQFLPWLLFGLLAGSVADHHDRRRLVMLADGSRAVDRAGARRLPRHRSRDRLDRPGHHLPVRHRRGLRRHGRQHAPADDGASGRPRHRQRPPAGRATWSAISSPARRSAPSSSRSDRSGRSSCRSSASRSPWSSSRGSPAPRSRSGTPRSRASRRIRSARVCAGCAATRPCARSC